MKSGLIIAVLFLSFFAQAGVLQKALDKHAKATSIQYDIKKTDEKIALQTKSESTGILKYQKSRIYISLNNDKKNEFYYADKVLSLVEHPDADFDKSGKRKVTILKKSIPPLVKSLLNLFSNPKSFTKEFPVISENSENGTSVIKLKSAQKNIKELALKINSKDYSLIELSFIDDVETKTSIEFSSLKLNTKMSKTDFQFKPAKTDEVLIQ
ncbi:outer-membrane lipoprotein carrier protein LolA [bacterium]|nr:outer-membrane lipoprotein carrier protein LolA [bacterium]